MDCIEQRSAASQGWRSSLDLGAGIGILGFIALEEGATEVIMVEPEPVIRAARKWRMRSVSRIECVLSKAQPKHHGAARGRCDPVRFHRQLSARRRLVPSLFSARERFLAPGGQLFPDTARMLVAPVEAAALYPRMVAVVLVAGIDLSVLRGLAENAIFDAPDQHGPRVLATPGVLGEFDFHTASHAACDSSFECEISVEGECHGLCGWFDARLGSNGFPPVRQPSRRLVASLPPRAEPVELRVGQAVAITVHRPKLR